MRKDMQGAGQGGSSRDRILRLLLKEPRTVDGLASALGITKNAVRAQLALLEREGQVAVRGEQKGSRRPAALYGLGPGASERPSLAYPAVLSGMVRTLADRLTPAKLEEVMRETGRRIAASVTPLSGNPRERVDGAVRFLGSIGSVADVVEEGGSVLIKGHGCPIAQAVQADKRSCLAIESLLAHLTGLPVRERCDREEHPGCRFAVELTAGSRQMSGARK